jgi:hypothetical protein
MQCDHTRANQISQLSHHALHATHHYSRNLGHQPADPQSPNINHQHRACCSLRQTPRDPSKWYLFLKCQAFPRQNRSRLVRYLQNAHSQISMSLTLPHHSLARRSVSELKLRKQSKRPRHVNIPSYQSTTNGEVRADCTATAKASPSQAFTRIIPRRPCRPAPFESCSEKIPS